MKSLIISEVQNTILMKPHFKMICSALPVYVKNNVILLVILDWKERADFYFEKLKLLSKRQLNVNFSHWFYRIWPRRARPHVFPAGFKFWPLIFWPLFSFSRTSSWASASFGIASARLRPSLAFASTSASCSFTFLSFFFLWTVRIIDAKNLYKVLFFQKLPF